MQKVLFSNNNIYFHRINIELTLATNFVKQYLNYILKIKGIPKKSVILGQWYFQYFISKIFA